MSTTINVRPSEENRYQVTAHARDQKTCEREQRQGLRGPDSQHSSSAIGRRHGLSSAIAREVVRMHSAGYSRDCITQELAVRRDRVDGVIASYESQPVHHGWPPSNRETGCLECDTGCALCEAP